MNEHKFVGNIKKSLLEHNIWSTILVDGADFSPRPCDLLACVSGKLVAVEAKFQRDFKAFGIKHIRDSQVLNLDFINQGGGMGFIFLNIFIPYKENRLLIWEWNQFKKITANGSIKKKELMEHPYLPCHKGRFSAQDMTHIIQRY